MLRLIGEDYEWLFWPVFIAEAAVAWWVISFRDPKRTRRRTVEWVVLGTILSLIVNGFVVHWVLGSHWAFG